MTHSNKKTTRIKGPTTLVDSKRIIAELNIDATTFCEVELYNKNNNDYKLNLSVENGICLYFQKDLVFKTSIDEAETAIRLVCTLIKDTWSITPITTKINFEYKNCNVKMYFGSGVGDWYEVEGPDGIDIAKEFNLPVWSKAEFNDLARYSWKDVEVKSLLKDGEPNKLLTSILNKIKSIDYNVSLKQIKSRLVNYNNDFSDIEFLYLAKTKQQLLSSNYFKKVDLESKISIIIPYFNTEESTLRVLRSLNTQWITPESYKNVQVIVIDDGSTASMDITTIKFPDYKYDFKVVRHDTNNGRSAARNTGSNYSNGDVLVFLDSDCIPHPSFIGEHWIRNNAAENCLFIGLKHDVMSLEDIPDDKTLFYEYSNDYRKFKNIGPDWLADKRIADWAHNNQRSLQPQNGEYKILETTNNLKDFSDHGWYGWWDLASVVVSHSISMRKETFKAVGGFSYSFRGWGYEDAFFGACAIALGVKIIPVLSSGVYHLEHEARSGNKAKKRNEKMQNELIYAKLLDMRVSDLNPTYIYS